MVRPRSRSAAGFTLVETMVAVLILTIIIGAIYAAFRATTAGEAVTRERADMNQTARIILAQINKELCSAYQRAGSQQSSIEGEDTQGSSLGLQQDKISILTTADAAVQSPGPAGDLRRVTYTVETTPDGVPVALSLVQDFCPDLSVAEEQPEPIELSTLVIGLNCKYLDPDTDEWMDDWVEKQTMPKAVRVELMLKPERKGSTPIMVSTTANLASAKGPGQEQVVQEEAVAQ